MILSRRWFAALILLAGTGSAAQSPAASTAAGRQIAVTFDDLPAAEAANRGTEALQDITIRLLAALRRERVTAIGFVNERGLETAQGIDSAREDLLAAWLRDGHELGNHTYSHPDLHTTDLTAYQADLARGERVTRALAARMGAKFRYFRHPFLHTGRSLAIRTEMDRFLTSRGYTVAPVTIDNHDYLFSAAWEHALASADTAGAERVRVAYLRYMEAAVAYYEEQSMRLLGREPPQVLLLHANPLNARVFGDLAAMLRRRGYTFVTLEQALRDDAYRSPDSYVGPAGITWLHRWALTAGKRGSFFAGEPEVPAWVEELGRER
jgi:peptidoglycan/xylan/chitin deacetylase (PgdA/CDA1 family)